MGRLTRSNPKVHSAGDRRTKRLALDESLVSKPSSAGRLSSSKGVLKRERTPVSVDKLPQRRESMLPRASEKFTSASAVNSREAKIMDRNPRPPPQRRKRPARQSDDTVIGVREPLNSAGAQGVGVRANRTSRCLLKRLCSSLDFYRQPSRTPLAVVTQKGGRSVL